MKYIEKSFSVPPATLRNGRNSHGQTWDDIFSNPDGAASALLSNLKKQYRACTPAERTAVRDVLRRVRSK